jgi:hypothetical protein
MSKDNSELVAVLNEIVIGSMDRLLHPEAKKVFKESIDNVRGWLLQRLKQLEFDETKHDINLRLNPFNESGYGLQSVSIEIRDKSSGKNVLSGNEWKDPTIGVIAPGMLSGESEYGIADFGIDSDKAECITALSKDGILLGEAKKGNGPKKHPKLLQYEESEIILGETHTARAIIELLKNPDAPREKIEKVLVREGVYSCEYLRGGRW